MSLLMNYNDQRFIKIAQFIFEEQFRRDPKLEEEMDDRRKRLMYDDVIYNISYLMTAVHFSDSKIFEGYALWIYELLCNIMKDLDRDRIMQFMTDHYSIMSEILNSHGKELLTEDELKKVTKYLEVAVEATKKSVTEIPLSKFFMEGEHFEVRKAYLDALITNQSKQAYEVINNAKNSGLPLTDIYEEILTKVMYEIGSLWHQNIITVDKEHYATSVTQTVMSRFYDEIFDRPKRNRTLVSCSVGSELHEMGIRMLSDVFEYNGWNTFYLGAALPESALLHAIDEYKPDLIALSVTMPPYLPVCESIVKAIREHQPNVKIAVGGQAFYYTDELWKKWDVDFYSESSKDLIHWADTAI
ncbi:cobalamin B12-binding domain-containing protein [Gudongella sp. DL1XJH-153]|uniref:cobalamin B12-binding domain-containing protein n=1 Tax=Gudongella sp. DL1XJH-153 TaxID=3409804 RepID=UPI003BB499DF